MTVSADHVTNIAAVHAASLTKDWGFHTAAQSWIWDWQCSGGVTYTTFGRAYHPDSPLLGDTALAAAGAAIYARIARRWHKARLYKGFLDGMPSVSQPLLLHVRMTVSCGDVGVCAPHSSNSVSLIGHH